MAVGSIVKCERCGTSYDEGRGDHWLFSCDAELERKQQQANQLTEFQAKSIDERFKVLYQMLVKITSDIDSRPYDGPIG